MRAASGGQQAESAQHRQHRDSESQADAGGLESEDHLVLPSGHGNNAEEEIAAHDGPLLAIDEGTPARVVGVAEDQQRGIG